MSLSLRAVLPVAASPITALQSLPVCASPHCPRPATLWQRWWARREGVWLHDHWYCSAGCFHAGLYRRLEQAAWSKPRASAGRNRLPLGLLMLSLGEITAEQLRQALSLQRRSHSGRIGEWLVGMGAVNEHQVTAALAAQQGCPVFLGREPQLLPPRLQWPELLARRYRALPVFYNPAQSRLFVGFLEQVDRSFLLSVEQVLRCRTQPCMVSRETYETQLDLGARDATAHAVEIHERQSCIEMMRMIGNYAEQIHAERCSIVRCEDRLWTRLEAAPGNPLDLVFSVSALN